MQKNSRNRTVLHWINNDINVSVLRLDNKKYLHSEQLFLTSYPAGFQCSSRYTNNGQSLRVVRKRWSSTGGVNAWHCTTSTITPCAVTSVPVDRADQWLRHTLVGCFVIYFFFFFFHTSYCQQDVTTVQKNSANLTRVLESKSEWFETRSNTPLPVCMCALTEQRWLPRTFGLNWLWSVSVFRSRRPHVHSIVRAVLLDERQSHGVENMKQLPVFSRESRDPRHDWQRDEQQRDALSTPEDLAHGQTGAHFSTSLTLTAVNVTCK